MVDYLLLRIGQNEHRRPGDIPVKDRLSLGLEQQAITAGPTLLGLVIVGQVL